MVWNIDFCCWNCQSNHTKRVERLLLASSSQMEANSNFWKGLHFSALLILPSFFSCSTFSTFLCRVRPACERENKTTKKKNLLAGKVTSSYFQVHCAVPSIIGQGFSLTAAGAPHWPCPAEQYSLVTAAETDLLSVASHRITSPPPLPPLLSSSPLSLHPSFSPLYF